MAGPLPKQTDVPVEVLPVNENKQQLRPPASNGARPEDTEWGERLVEDNRDHE
jgi:hypothetical protein